MEYMEYLNLVPGYRTALADGTMVPDSPKHMASEELYRAFPGDCLRICNENYLFAPAVFSLERNPVYIYSYAYQREENWSAYTGNLTPDSYSGEDYVFSEECWFRVCVRRRDGEDLTEADKEYADRLMEFYHKEREYKEKPWFGREIKDTAESIKREDNPHTMKLCLLTDTHFAVNGTWEDTAYNIRRVAEEARYDAIVHLGDITDGMLSKKLTAKYGGRIIDDLEKCQVPVYITPGNHDSNYFQNRENTLTVSEMRNVYRLKGKDEGRIDYYIDVPKYGVRMIFLNSFDDTACIRYGYTQEQLEWVKNVLYGAENGTRFLIFSHDAPLAKLDYWSFYVRNGENLLDILEECNAEEHYQIAGFFYGHTHSDYIFEECSFPVVSTGCAKLEYFPDKKPKEAVTWHREADTVTQDLWDSVLIDFENEKLKMIRFGAGDDREIYFKKKKSTYKNTAIMERMNRPVKIWAHRGASGHAPENTMPAFELAYQLGADGIELDVQLTKDGALVVIHDERIDRVSDGTGYVRDYTLEEIRTFNMNRQFPAYGRVQIPTLSEVYDFVKNTDMVLNLELKNSVIFYEELEEKALRLAEEKGLADRIIYSSFNHYSMRKIQRLLPKARTAFLYSDGFIDIGEYAKRYGAYAVHPSIGNMRYPGNDIVKSCHEKNIRVNVWTVNEEADFERMRALGVDAVITNYVERG